MKKLDLQFVVSAKKDYGIKKNCTTEHKKEKRGAIMKVCKFCGKEFITYSWRGKGLYCSTECAVNDRKIEHTPNTTCCICGKPIYIKPSRIKRSKTNLFTCSIECMGKMRSQVFIGAKNPNYKIDCSKSIYYNNGNKYYHVLTHNHPYRDKLNYVPEHRLVVENHYYLFDEKYFDIINGKYYLKKDVSVHHINHNTLDNDINNLIPVTKSEHTTLHNREKEIIRDSKGRITGVLKRGELLENPNDKDNQQPSINSNINKGSTTNSRFLTDNAEESNANTSALPNIDNIGEDIV